jgi:hypothetical protein
MRALSVDCSVRQQQATPFAAPDFRLWSHAERLMAAYSRIGQSTAALRKTPDLYRA